MGFWVLCEWLSMAAGFWEYSCSPRVDTEAGPKLLCNITVVLTMMNR